MEEKTKIFLIEFILKHSQDYIKEDLEGYSITKLIIIKTEIEVRFSRNNSQR